LQLGHKKWQKLFWQPECPKEMAAERQKESGIRDGDKQRPNLARIDASRRNCNSFGPIHPLNLFVHVLQLQQQQHGGNMKQKRRW